MPFGFAYVLPVGISFFTFQSMSYTIDFYLGKVAARAELPPLRDVRLLFPAAHGRADRARQASAAAVPAAPDVPAAEPHRRPVAVPGGLVQEAGAGQLSGALRRSRLRQSRSLRRSGADAGDLRLCLADLLRLQRLHRHGPRRRAG